MANDQFGWENKTPFHLVATDQADQLPDGLPPDLLNGSTHGGQWWSQDAGKKRIIKAHHSYFFGNLAAGLLQGLYNPDGVIIVAGEDAIELQTIGD